jgi:hypothetical protein
LSDYMSQVSEHSSDQTEPRSFCDCLRGWPWSGLGEDPRGPLQEAIGWRVREARTDLPALEAAARQQEHKEGRAQRFEQPQAVQCDRERDPV